MSGSSGGEGCRNHVCLGVKGLVNSRGGWEGQEVAPGRGAGAERDRQQAGSASDQRGLGAGHRAGGQGLGGSLKSELGMGWQEGRG